MGTPVFYPPTPGGYAADDKTPFCHPKWCQNPTKNPVYIYQKNRKVYGDTPSLTANFSEKIKVFDPVSYSVILAFCHLEERPPKPPLRTNPPETGVPTFPPIRSSYDEDWKTVGVHETSDKTLEWTPIHRLTCRDLCHLLCHLYGIYTSSNVI